MRNAFCTVTGLAPYCATSARVDGNRAPGAAAAIHPFKPPTMRELLSSYMRIQSSATVPESTVVSPQGSGLRWGLLGVVAFSFTVPFTRIAVADGAISPLLVGSGRAVVAGLLAVLVLRVLRQPVPTGRQWVRLAVVAGGVVVGFPFLTSYALTTASAAHSAVVIALLPAATAVMAVLRGRESPPRSFWVAAGLGAIAAVGFAAVQGGSFELHSSDVLLLAAVVVCAIGYAEGGLVSRELGSWQTISWALVLSLPVMAVLAVIAIDRQPPTATATQWSAFAYLAVISMFLGFFAWYRGLAIGPMAQVSQVQLVQPVLTICWAALFLHEPLTWSTVIGGCAVIACALGAVRTRGRKPDRG